MLRATLISLCVASCASQSDHKDPQKSEPKVEPQKPTEPAAPPVEPPVAAPAAPPVGSGAAKKPEPNVPVHLTWKVAKNPSGKALDVQYKVENKTDRPIMVLDQVLGSSAKGVFIEPERVLVKYDPASATVVLVAGHLKVSEAVKQGAGVGVASETFPAARELAAGASLTGTKKVPLPLAPYHPDLSMPLQVMDAIPASATKIVLEVTWMSDTAPTGQPIWEQRAAADGSKLKVPTSRHINTNRQTLRGDVLKMP